MSTATQTNPTLDLRHAPPFDERTPQPIRDAAAAHREAHTRAVDARRNLDAIDTPANRQQAEKDDARALADAQAAGKRDPGPKHVQAHENAVSDARRHHDAAKLNEQDRAEDLQEAITEYSYEWLEALESADEQTAERYRASLDQADIDAAQLAANRAVRGWLDGRRFKTSIPHVYDRDQKRPVGELLDTLRTFGSPPPEQRGPVYLNGR